MSQSYEQQRNSSRGGKRKRGTKKHVFPPYNRQDLADAIGVSQRSLDIYITEHCIPLNEMTLAALYTFISTLKDKRPLNPNRPKQPHKQKAAPD